MGCFLGLGCFWVVVCVWGERLFHTVNMDAMLSSVVVSVGHVEVPEVKASGVCFRVRIWI
jgi:hypothetical protein